MHHPCLGLALCSLPPFRLTCYFITTFPGLQIGGSVVDELTHAGFREQGQARSGHLHLPKVRPEKTMERSDNEKKITPLCFIVGRYMEPGSVF